MKRGRDNDSDDDEEVSLTLAERKRIAKLGINSRRTDRLSRLITREEVHDGEGEHGDAEDNDDEAEELLRELNQPAKARTSQSLLDQAYVMKKMVRIIYFPSNNE